MLPGLLGGNRLAGRIQQRLVSRAVGAGGRHVEGAAFDVQIANGRAAGRAVQAVANRLAARWTTPLPVAAEVTRLKFPRKQKRYESLLTSAATF